jgi:hypothetical protein
LPKSSQVLVCPDGLVQDFRDLLLIVHGQCYRASLRCWEPGSTRF